MQRESEEPVRILREKVAIELAAIDELERKFTQQSMKEAATRARFAFEEVELVLGTLVTEYGTASMEAQTISRANLVFEDALSERKRLQHAFASRGAGAVLIVPE